MREFKHTIHFTNENGQRVKRHFYTQKEVYTFLECLPNDAKDVWTRYGEEESA